MSVNVRDILTKSPKLLTFSSGNKEAIATHPCSSLHPEKSAIVYAPKLDHIEQCVKAAAAIIVVPNSLEPSALGEEHSSAILKTSDLSLAMALINQEFFPVLLNRQPLNQESIHSTAAISESAKIGENCIIGPHVTIGDQVTIGDRTIINANVVIEAESKIGSDCHLQALCFVGHSSIIGNQCVIHPNTTIASDGYGFATDQNFHHHRKPHYGRVILEDRVEVGAGVQIDRGAYQDTIIGEGTKIDNHCHLAHNFKTGKNCLITAGFITAGSSSVGSRCVFGGRTSLNGHIHVCDDVTAAGMSVISNHVKEPGAYGGWPLQKMKESLRVLSSTVHLPKMRKQLQQVMKKLNLE